MAVGFFNESLINGANSPHPRMKPDKSRMLCCRVVVFIQSGVGSSHWARALVSWMRGGGARGGGGGLNSFRGEGC